ncbi:hypothetical protein C8Q80DRAFT_1119579 [Daedaleopsis nitida]|nr:hypothetical protein C8Q80DRAFT_1119579 [Daedaleopsis nitida]
MPDFELNDDVLRHIAHYLTGCNALNLALVSKRLHDLALNRVVETFVASSPDKLRAFHRYVLDNAHRRAHHIESLEIDYMAFYREEDMDVVGCVDNDDDYQFDEGTVQLVIDLLEHVPNLRKLALHPRSDVLSRCGNFSKLAFALTSDALRRLQWVELNSLNNTVLRLLSQTRWDLRVLSLRHQERWEDDDYLSYSALVDALATFPNLHTFKLCDFNIAEWDPSSVLPQRTERRTFTKIHRLVLDYGDTALALDLINRCPNVKLLVLDLVQLNSTTMEELKPPGSHPFPAWPPLHSLRSDVHELHEMLCSELLVDANPVLHLQTLTKAYPADTGGEDEGGNAMLLSLLTKLPPVWAQLWVEVGSAPMRLWKDVPERAPRLRYLDLKISIPALKEEYANWLDNVPDALSPLPLLYLGLHIHDMPRRSFVFDDASGAYLTDANGDYVWDVTGEREEQFRADRDAAALTFPERCARAIPTLKFFALHHSFEHGGARSVLADERKEDVDLVRGAEHDRRPEGENHEYALIGGSWADFYSREVRLWRIARVGDECRVQRLLARYRRRLQQCLEMCFDGGEPLDVMLALYQESELAR